MHVKDILEHYPVALPILKDIIAQVEGHADPNGRRAMAALANLVPVSSV